jgi:hypothetical protein
MPDPEILVDPAFLEYLARERDSIPSELLEELEDQAIEDFSAAQSTGDVTSSPGMPMPASIRLGSTQAHMKGSVGDLIGSAIAQVAIEWRLDAVMVLTDLLDAWEEDE